MCDLRHVLIAEQTVAVFAGKHSTKCLPKPSGRPGRRRRFPAPVRRWGCFAEVLNDSDGRRSRSIHNEPHSAGVSRDLGPARRRNAATIEERPVQTGCAFMNDSGRSDRVNNKHTRRNDGECDAVERLLGFGRAHLRTAAGYFLLFLRSSLLLGWQNGDGNTCIYMIQYHVFLFELVGHQKSTCIFDNLS